MSSNSSNNTECMCACHINTGVTNPYNSCKHCSSSLPESKVEKKCKHGIEKEDCRHCTPCKCDEEGCTNHDFPSVEDTDWKNESWKEEEREAWRKEYGDFLEWEHSCCFNSDKIADYWLGRMKAREGEAYERGREDYIKNMLPVQIGIIAAQTESARDAEWRKAIGKYLSHPAGTRIDVIFDEDMLLIPKSLLSKMSPEKENE